MYIKLFIFRFVCARRVVPVCQAAFASLHGVTPARVRRLASSSLLSTCAPAERWGKHTNRPNKISDKVRLQIDQHIHSFPTMKSHYSRQRQKYLSPDLNVVYPKSEMCSACDKLQIQLSCLKMNLKTAACLILSFPNNVIAYCSEILYFEN